VALGETQVMVVDMNQVKLVKLEKEDLVAAVVELNRVHLEGLADLVK